MSWCRLNRLLKQNQLIWLLFFSPTFSLVHLLLSSTCQIDGTWQEKNKQLNMWEMKFSGFCRGSSAMEVTEIAILLLFYCCSITVVPIPPPLALPCPAPCSLSQSPPCCPCPWVLYPSALTAPFPFCPRYPPLRSLPVCSLQVAGPRRVGLFSILIN